MAGSELPDGVRARALEAYAVPLQDVISGATVRVIRRAPTAGQDPAPGDESDRARPRATPASGAVRLLAGAVGRVFDDRLEVNAVGLDSFFLPDLEVEREVTVGFEVRLRDGRTACGAASTVWSPSGRLMLTRRGPLLCCPRPHKPRAARLEIVVVTEVGYLRARTAHVAADIVRLSSHSGPLLAGEPVSIVVLGDALGGVVVDGGDADLHGRWEGARILVTEPMPDDLTGRVIEMREAQRGAPPERRSAVERVTWGSIAPGTELLDGRIVSAVTTVPGPPRSIGGAVLAVVIDGRDGRTVEHHAFTDLVGIARPPAPLVR